MNKTGKMCLIIDKFRKGYRFRCPITKTFYGPFFKTKESIEDFLNWYDDDILFVGTWMNGNRDWNNLLQDWGNTENGKQYCKFVSPLLDHTTLQKTITLDKSIDVT